MYAIRSYYGPVLRDLVDPQRFYRPPQSFSSQLELPAEINSSQALAFPLKRLLEELCGVLRGGDTTVQSLHIVLQHEDHPDSLLELGTQSSYNFV